MVAAAAEPFFAPDSTQLDIGVGEPRRQDRVTVAFRALLVLPHVVVLLVLTFVAIPLVFVGWFAALGLGRLPRWIAAYVMSVIAYAVRVYAYGFMLAGEFPAFSLSLSHSDYPIAVQIEASHLSRLKVFFRLLLFIPAYIVTAVVGNGLLFLSPIIWLVTLVLGRMPQPFFSAAAAVIRYQARYSAYIGLVTDTYPRRAFGDAASDFAPEGFRVHRSGLVMWVIVVLGLVAVIGGIVVPAELRSTTNPALVLAENNLEGASQIYIDAVQSCGTGPTALRCVETQDRTWGEAFNEFASTLSAISLSGSQQADAHALALGARQVGRALIVASQAKTAAQHHAAFLVVERALPPFEQDAKLLLGHGL
jgi:hypothetical protein